MTVDFHITLDTDKAEKFLNDFQKRQIPFATSLAMNNSMKDAQRAVRGSAYPNVFTVRNRSLAKALTTIPSGHWATNHNLRVTMMNVRDSKTGNMAGEGFIERQIAGASKIPKGKHIAIPVIGPGMRRLKGGSISAAKKPRAMGKKLIKIEGKGKRSDGLYQRMRGDKLRKRYNLVTSARSNRRGRFQYLELGQDVILNTIHGHWRTALNRALSTAK